MEEYPFGRESLTTFQNAKTSFCNNLRLGQLSNAIAHLAVLQNESVTDEQIHHIILNLIEKPGLDSIRFV